MSLSEILWDITQEQRITDLEKEVEELKEQMAVCAKWIVFLSNKNFSCPRECTMINKDVP
mgnify:CR=1 FL=1